MWIMNLKYFCFLSSALILTILSGCSSLLPKEKNLTVGIWNSYEEAENTFDLITPYVTNIHDLIDLNLNPEGNKNITILNYAEIANRFDLGGGIKEYIPDKGISECIIAKSECRGYLVNEKVLKSKRYGNFLSDLLNFKRKTDITGWEFKGVILIKNNLVVYKLSSGIPALHEKVESFRPLGPFQGGGFLVNIAKKNYQ